MLPGIVLCMRSVLYGEQQERRVITIHSISAISDDAKTAPIRDLRRYFFESKKTTETLLAEASVYIRRAHHELASHTSQRGSGPQRFT